MRLTPKENGNNKAILLPSKLAHDLLQPLNAFGLAKDEFLDSIGDLFTKNKQAQQAWEIMDGVISHANNLLIGLRKYLYLQQNTEIFQVSQIKLSSIIDELPESRNGIRVVKSGNFEIFVLSNRDALITVLNATIDNATKFAEQVVEVSASITGKVVQIAVTDDGSGIPDDVISQLGVPFIHSRPSRNNRQKGLGLGLYISAIVCERTPKHLLEIGKAKNHGTKISLSIPRTCKFDNCEYPSQNQQTVDPLVNLRILLIDNDPKSAQRFIKQMSAWGCLLSSINLNTASKIKLKIKYNTLIINQQSIRSHEQELITLLKAIRATEKIVVIGKPHYGFSESSQLKSLLKTAIKIEEPISPTKLRATLASALPPP